MVRLLSRRRIWAGKAVDHSLVLPMTTTCVSPEQSNARLRPPWSFQSGVNGGFGRKSMK
jgi:hypothetical protein